MTATEIMQKVQLVKGEFTATEAISIIDSLISQKVNFHKVQRFQNWERDHGCETEQCEGRIKELLRDKQAAIDFLHRAIEEGCDVEIQGELKITFSKPADTSATSFISDN